MVNATTTPEYVKKLKTLSSIPTHFHGVFPSKMAVEQDKAMAERENNPAYERMQRIKDKRDVENAIQNVNATSE